MKAIILAAGRGSRMSGLTKDNPKCLVKLDGRPLLDYQLEALRGAGINEIAVVTGYKKEMLAPYQLTEFCNENWESTNMVSSLCCAHNWLASDDCIVSYSDIFYEKAAIKSLINTTDDIAITYDPNWLQIWQNRFEDPLVDAETFAINEQSFLTEIGNKPDSLDDIRGQYMGLLKFSLKGWSSVLKKLAELSQEDQGQIHMTGLLQKLINSSAQNVKAIPYFGCWGEIDSQDDLASFDKSLKPI